MHKAECRRAAAAFASASASASALPSTCYGPSSSSVECRLDKVKGRSLFATKMLPVGCHPFAPTTKVDDDGGLCESFVHPVLLEQLRKFRCSYCFRTVPEFSNTTESSSSVPNSKYSAIHRHCSHECRKLDTNWLIEERAARTFPSPPSSMVLLCSRLIRKFINIPSSIEEFNSLSPGADWIPTLPSTDEKMNDSALLLAKCKIFLMAMANDQSDRFVHTRYMPDLLTSSRFIRRVNTNGFTISDAEQIPIGMGLYMQASVINHACRPNAIQTFWLRPQKPPMLQLTMVTTIQAGDEITISYCDTSAPRLDRNGTLLQDYNFICDCHFCKDTSRDDDIYGLHCIKKSCATKGARMRSTGRHNMLDDYRCELCGQNRSDDKATALQQIYAGIKEISDPIQGAVDAERKAYTRMKSTCQVNTSYFYALAAKQFASTIGNVLRHISDERERLDLIGEALTAMNESKTASKFCFDFPGSLQWALQRGEEAKLRLYSNPMDVEAWNTLNEVKLKLLDYYPRCDETILSLDETLHSYSCASKI